MLHGHWEAVDKVRLLVGRDSKSNMVFAHIIPAKGVSHGSFNADRMREDLAKLNYKRVVVRCDKEPALVAQIHAAQRAIGVEIVDFS